MFMYYKIHYFGTMDIWINIFVIQDFNFMLFIYIMYLCIAHAYNNNYTRTRTHTSIYIYIIFFYRCIISVYIAQLYAAAIIQDISPLSVECAESIDEAGKYKYNYKIFNSFATIIHPYVIENLNLLITSMFI